MATLTRDEELSIAVASLMRGPVYAEEDQVAWTAIRQQAGRIHDHMKVMGLRLVVDDADEFAFLRSMDELPEGMPRLARRHALTRTTTMLLVRLRQRMIAAEAQEATPRLIVSGDDLMEELRIYHPPGASEDRMLRDIERLVDLGYLKRLRGQDAMFEARRVIKALVSADWLASYAERLFAAEDDATGQADPGTDPGDDAGDDTGGDPGDDTGDGSGT